MLNTNFRFWLQDAWMLLFGEHIFSTISRRNKLSAALLLKANYARRIWDMYPIARCSDGRELLFIHIPKCAGTSVARALGFRKVRHLPALVLAATDPRRFQDAVRFSVVRYPLDKLSSLIRHFRGSPIAGKDDIARAHNLRLSQVPMDVCVDRFISDQRFRKKFFLGTTAGRCGFSVTQTDFISNSNRLLVPNLFSFARLSSLEEWLRATVSPSITLPHANQSTDNQRVSLSREREQVAREFFRDDYRLYDTVMQHGGAIVEANSIVRRVI